MLTEEKKNALVETLMSKSVRELINIIIEQQEEIEEAKQIRRRFKQIVNLCLEPDERAKRGRPKK